MYFTDEKKSQAKTKLIILGIIAVLVIIVLLQNSQVVTFRLFFWQISISQILLMPLTLLFGFAVGAAAVLLLSKKKQRDSA